MPLPDFRINPYVQAPVQGLSQEYGQLMDQKILDYDTNLAAVDMWEDQNNKLKQSVGPFAKDQAAANEIMNQTRGQIDELAARGDYENMGRQVRKGATQFVSKIQPLIQNQQKYQAYGTELNELFKAGKIGHDTMAKAQAKSLEGYDGIDPTNPQGTMFTGFVPSPDVSLSDKALKFVDKMKADGFTTITDKGDGSVRTVKVSQLKEQDVRDAVNEYFKGDTESKGYGQTQVTIGNEARLKSEIDAAVEAAAKHAGFKDVDERESYKPEYMYKNAKGVDMLGKLPTEPNPAAYNLSAKSIFANPAVAYNPETGKMSLSTMTEFDGTEYKSFVNPKGEPISAKEFYGAGTTSGGTGGKGQTPEELGFKKVPITKEEAAAAVKDYNDTLLDMAGERKFRMDYDEAQAMPEGFIKDSSIAYLEEALNDPAKMVEYLERNKADYSDPKFVTQTKSEYDEAMKNSEILQGNETFPIAAIPGSVSPQITSIADDDILASNQGRRVGLLTVDPEFKEFVTRGQKVDLNATLDEVKRVYGDKYEYKGVRRIGPMAQNPFDSYQGAMEYSIILEDKESKIPKNINFAATINDDELQPLHRVKTMGSAGMNGTVDFKIRNGSLGEMEGKFRVRSGTMIVAGKRVFSNYVEVLSPDGVKIVGDTRTGFRQNIPMAQFAEHYRQFYAPQLVNKYVNPKLK